MKFVKLSVIALSMGLFLASCGGSSTTEETAPATEATAPEATPAPEAAAPAPVDSAAAATPAPTEAAPATK